jgi:hypothetical protein
MRDYSSKWRRQVLPLIRELSPEVARRYSSEGELEHFERLAATSERELGNPLISAAAFLHGVELKHLRKLGSNVPEHAFQILTALHGFRQLDIRHTRLPQRLRQKRYETARLQAAYLLVLDHLDHLDPERRTSEWSRDFHARPDHPHVELPAAPRFLEPHENPSVRVAFVEAVVTPTALSLGLWHERNVLADAALLFRDPGRFSTAVEFARKFSSRDSACGRWTDVVQGALSDLSGIQVRWEWQHAAHISSRLPAGSEVQLSWKSQVRRCGAVIVVCDRDATIYEAFGRIHASFPFASAGFRGSAFGPTRSGYSALHTSIFLSDDGRVGAGGDDAPILVKIMSRLVEQRRFHSFSGAVTVDPVSPRKGEIVVSAPSGAEVALPAGATVLDFAAKIHGEFVVLARGARVNREMVDLLHELHDGDVVWLDLGVAPRLLPEGWEERVPRATHGEIRQQFKKFYRAALGNSGERWLRSELLRRGLSGDVDAGELRELLKVALRSAKLQPLPNVHDGGWWLEQMGILEARIRGEAIPHELLISEAQREALLEEVARLSFEHAPPEPSSQPQGPQHIVVEGADRAGLVADVATVFAERGLGMTEFVATQLNPGRGLLRVRVDPMDAAQLENLLDAIRRTSSVRAVHPPGSGQTADEKLFLPQRQDSRVVWRTTPSPYVRGDPVQDDAHFYGMQTQLAKLRQAYDAATTLHALGPESRQAFVSGPKKVGKTSLALAFLRSVVSTERCIGVHLEAVSKEPWHEFALRLADQIYRRAVEINGGSRASLPTPRLHRSLGNFLHELRTKLDCPIVLAVDEAVMLFQATVERGDEQDLFRFASEIQHVPGLQLIWIGPEAPLRHLPDRLQHMLRSTQQILMKPFSRAVMKEFLRAKKMESRYTIYIEQTLVDSIHDLTAGNPYWAASIADEMWSSLQEENLNLIQYDESILDQAVQRVSHHRTAFADRYDSDVWTAQEKAFAWELLVTLARSNASGMVTSAVIECTALRTGAADPRSAVTLLEELEERGAVTSGPAGWRIAAPLFGNHVRIWEQRLAAERSEHER